MRLLNNMVLLISTDSGTTWLSHTTLQGLGNDTVTSVFASGSSVYAGTANGLSIALDNLVPLDNR